MDQGDLSISKERKLPVFGVNKHLHRRSPGVAHPKVVTPSAIPGFGSFRNGALGQGK